MKTMALRRMDGVALGVIGLTAALTALVYDRLPERLATHWDLEGNANGWMPRAVAACFAPGLALALWGLLRSLPRVLPSSERKRLGEASAALVGALLVTFLAGVHVLILYVALVPGASLTRAVWILLGAFYIALGLVLPRIKRNALIGIRTPWTLTSDENWARTQRVGSYAMVVGGVMSALLGALGGLAGGIMAIGCLLVSALVPAGYSLLLARRQDHGP